MEQTDKKTIAFEQYSSLEGELACIRWRDNDQDTPEEEALLERIEEAWWLLTDEEQEHFRHAPQRKVLLDTNTSLNPDGPKRIELMI